MNKSVLSGSYHSGEPSLMPHPLDQNPRTLIILAGCAFVSIVAFLLFASFNQDTTKHFTFEVYG